MVYISTSNLGKKTYAKDNSLKIVNTFTRRVISSGIISQARKNKFFEKDESKNKRKKRALFRKKRQANLLKDYKMGKGDMMLDFYIHK